MKQAAPHVTGPASEAIGPVSTSTEFDDAFPNPLIQNHVADTLSACCNVLQYLEEATQAVDIGPNGNTIGDGLRWIFMTVNQALRYEYYRTKSMPRFVAAKSD